MEVYIDNMLIKSTDAKDNVRHLEDCFNVLRKNGMKLNLAKCTFRVSSGKFLGFLVTQKRMKLVRNKSKHSKTYRKL